MLTLSRQCDYYGLEKPLGSLIVTYIYRYNACEKE